MTAIEVIFTKLIATYGRDFTSRYAGQDSAAVREHWAHELRAYLPSCMHPKGRPEAIRFALDNLPPAAAPNVLEFRALCARAPNYNAPALAAPKPDPAKVRKVMATARAALAAGTAGREDWAGALEARASAGDVALTQFQREAIRNVKAKRCGADADADAGEAMA